MAITVYRSSCDASAAARIGADSEFVTASDEDDILRVYNSSAGCDVEVFSDDGDVLVRGKKCNKVKDKTLRSFRSVTFRIELSRPDATSRKPPKH